jgi:hypothetical protein
MGQDATAEEELASLRPIKVILSPPVRRGPAKISPFLWRLLLLDGITFTPLQPLILEPYNVRHLRPMGFWGLAYKTLHGAGR